MVSACTKFERSRWTLQIRFEKSRSRSRRRDRHATRSAERGVSATSISRPRMPFRPVSSNHSRHVLRAHRRFTALVYATFRSPTTPHRSRVTRHLPADIGHGNGWILLSDSTNQRIAMAGYCYQILNNQSVPPMRGRV